MGNVVERSCDDLEWKGLKRRHPVTWFIDDLRPTKYFWNTAKSNVSPPWSESQYGQRHTNTVHKEQGWGKDNSAVYMWLVFFLAWITIVCKTNMEDRMSLLTDVHSLSIYTGMVRILRPHRKIAKKRKTAQKGTERTFHTECPSTRTWAKPIFKI